MARSGSKEPDWNRFGLEKNHEEPGTSSASEKTKLTSTDKEFYGGQPQNDNELFAEDQGSRAPPWWLSHFLVSERVLFGTWDGVFTSCLINIFGVIVFLRSGWIVAEAGIGHAALIVLAAVSLILIAVLSAIGICDRCHVQSGGVYFLISHVLGSRRGAAVGIIYVFGQAIGNALCATGFGESISGLISSTPNPWVERAVAAVIILLLTAINLAGVKWVIRLQFVLLVVLLLGAADFTIGSFSHEDRENGFYGWNSTIWHQNSKPNYTDHHNWFSVFGVFFPALTGVMAGINMSGDLKNPSQDISIGTLAAVAAGLLLESGSSMGARDARGYTPLHVATKAGNVNAVRLLLDRGADPDSKAKRSLRTPLHKARSPKIVKLLLQYGADPFAIANCSAAPELKESVFQVLLRRNQNAAIAMLNEFISTNGHDIDSSDLLIVYDLRLFEREAHYTRERAAVLASEKITEIPAHEKMVEQRQRDVLKHPLTETFLHLKWEVVKKFYVCNTVLYSLFVLFLSITSCLKTEILSHSNFEYDEGKVSFHDLTRESPAPLNRAAKAFYSFTWIFLFIIATREFLQAAYGIKRWARDRENWIEVCQIISTFCFLVSLYSNIRISTHFEAIAVFLAWIELTMLIGRAPTIGIYSYMFTHVIKTVLMFLMVYITVLIGFALAFHILLPKHEIFANPFIALISCLVMMTGEFDFSDNFSFKNVTDTGSPVFVQLVFVLFLILVSIIISNLLIGLTVNQTDELFKEAGVLRLEKTALQIFALENTLLGRPNFVTRLFPRAWREYLEKQCLLCPILSQDFVICIKAYETATGRGEIRSGFSRLGNEFKVYAYDPVKGVRGQKLPLTLPNWIVNKTINMLRPKTERELCDLSSSGTVLSDLDGDNDEGCCPNCQSPLSGSTLRRTFKSRPNSSFEFLDRIVEEDNSFHVDDDSILMADETDKESL